MSVNGRHAVADRQRVRRPRERELDVLAREQFHRAATRRFGGQRVRGRVEGENGPVRRGILRLLLEHPERGAATGDEGRVDRRHRLAWSRGGGGRGAHGTHRERRDPRAEEHFGETLEDLDGDSIKLDPAMQEFCELRCSSVCSCAIRVRWRRQNRLHLPA
jgi:hypothetical protein